MRNATKLLLVVAFAIGIGYLTYTRSAEQVEAPAPESATLPVETTEEAVPAGEPHPATPESVPGSEIQPTEPAVPENGQPAPQTPN